MNYNNKQIGERIKKIRKKKGKSLKDVAEFLKCNERTVRNYESGQAVPLAKLLLLCNELECDMGYLLGEYDESNKDIAFICRETGLSAEAVNALKENRMTTHSDFVNRYIINGTEISQAIERLKEAPTSVTDRMKYYEFDVMDSFLDLVKEYIRRG